jgi:deoxycytidylate deaminase
MINYINNTPYTDKIINKEDLLYTISENYPDNKSEFSNSTSNSLISLEENMKLKMTLNDSNNNLSLRDKLRKSKDKYIVIYPELSYEDFLELKNKGAFKLINIYCPFNKRYENFNNKYKNKFSLEDFIQIDSLMSCDPKFHKLRENANTHLYNNNSLQSLKNNFEDMVDMIFIYYRPLWDDYFMAVAHILANRSNCIKQKVGAILVKNGRILSTGYNGTPKGMINCFEGGCERCNNKEITQGISLDTCWCIHAEQNAVKYFLDFFNFFQFF